MSFRMNCPHCAALLNVTEVAFGKTVPCPGCNRPVSVPDPTQAAASNPRAAAPRASIAPNVPTPSTPPEIPPLPPANSAYDFLGSTVDSGGRSRGPVGRVGGLNLADMFAGNEKEYVFTLFPGEEHLNELTIFHQHFLLVRAGVTRVILTTHRLLYTSTRVFSPLYWLLLALFPPLIFYYAARMSRNRNVALPLGSLDSVEKRYLANGVWFLLAVIVGTLLATFCSNLVGGVFHPANRQPTSGGAYSAAEVIVFWLVLGVLSLAVLVLLLATRIVRLEFRSMSSNRIALWLGVGTSGLPESQIDSFLQRLHSQIEQVRSHQARTNAPAT